MDEGYLQRRCDRFYSFRPCQFFGIESSPIKEEMMTRIVLTLDLRVTNSAEHPSSSSRREGKVLILYQTLAIDSTVTIVKG